jgi:hypothetical protein
MKQVLIIALILSALTAKASSDSAYTDINQACRVLSSSEDDPNAEIDYFTSVCPGREGFDVRLDGGDSRSWISLVKKGTSEFVAEDISFGEYAGQFPNVAGSKLEWRYTNGQLTSLIVRMSGQDPEDYTNQLVTLNVVRIDKRNLSEICVVGRVNAKQADANQKARDIADNAAAKCLTWQ